MQREGRIIRQGNWNPKVKVKTYVTENSFDALMWKTLENKAKFIAQVMSGDSKVRSMEEIAEIILSYSEIGAEATNNEAMKKLLIVEKELRNLKDLEMEHAKEQAYYANRIQSLPEAIEKNKKLLQVTKEAEAAAINIDGDQFYAEMDGVVYSEATKPKDVKDYSPRKAFREALLKKLEPLVDVEETMETSNLIATIGGLELRYDATFYGFGNSKISKQLSFEYTGKNGKTIQYQSETLNKAMEKELQGFMIKVANALRPLSEGQFSKTREKNIEKDEAALKEAKEKGGKPFPDRERYEKLLKEVADLREEARQYELTNSFDSVFQKGKDLYVISGIDYEAVPSKNKKKQQEEKPDYVTSVYVTKIGEIQKDVEYLDENDEHRTINVFQTEGMEEMRDIAFIRDFIRREDVVGVTSNTFASRLREIERIKEERKAQEKEREKILPSDDMGMTEPAPTPTNSDTTNSGNNNPTPPSAPPSGPPSGTHTRRIKRFGVQATVEKVNVDNKDYWTVKTSVKGKDWGTFKNFFQQFDGVYHGKDDKVKEFKTKVVFEKYPEDFFEPTSEAKAFKLSGGDTIQHNVSPKTAQKVSHKIAKALKTVLRPGNVSKRGAVAQFKPHQNSGNFKNKFIHNIRVQAHELGHAFEEKGFTGDQAEILAVGSTYYPAWADLNTQALQMSEGRAELFTLYIINPAMAQHLAPNSVEEMEQIIDSDPKIKKVFDEIKAIMEEENTKGEFEKAIGSIAMPSDDRTDRTIGDEYKLDAIPDGLSKAQELRYQVTGWSKRKLTEVVDFKIPFKDVQKAREEHASDGKDLVKMLAITGNSEIHARRAFSEWAQDHLGRYIINYQNVADLPDFLDTLYTEMNEMDPRRITGKQKQYDERLKRYSRIYKEGIKKGLSHDAAKERAILEALSSRSLQEISEDGIVMIAEKINSQTLPEDFKKEIKRIRKNKNKESVEFQIFTSVLQAYRARERYSREDENGNKKFKEVYMSEETANAVIARSQAIFPGLEDILQEYTHNLSEIILSKLTRAGVETEETRERIEEGSDWYVPTYYNEKGAGVSTDSVRKGPRSVLNRFRGRQAVAIDYLEATTYKLLEVEQAIEFKMVLDELEKALREKDMGLFGEIVSQERAMEIIGGGQIADQIGDVLRGILGDAVVDQNKLVESIAANNYQRFMPTDMLKQSKPILMNTNGDKKVFMVLAPDLYDSIKSMKPVHIRGFMRFLARLSSYNRYFSISNFKYILNVLLRDLPTAFIQKDYKGSVLKAWLRGAALSAGLDPKIADMYAASGAFMSAEENVLNSMKRANVTNGLVQTKVKGFMKTKAGRFVHILNPSTVLKWQEQINRYGAWVAKANELAAEYNIDPKKLFDGREPLTEDEQDKVERMLLEMGYEASEITQNYRTHGTSEFARKFVMPISFLHGGMQGLYREGREIKEHPWRVGGRSMMSLLPVTILAWAALQALDPDDKDDITSEMRDKYWIIPTGNHYLFFAKPYGYSYFFNHMERFLDDALGGEGARDWNEDMLNPFVQNVSLPFMPIYIETIMDLAYNEAWYGGDIVADENASKFNQIDSKSSKLAEWQLQAEFALFGDEEKTFLGVPLVISPDKFDYAIQQTFGQIGQMASNEIDTLAGKPKPLLNSGQVNVPEKSALGSRFMEKLYNDIGDAEKEYDRGLKSGKYEKGKPPEKLKAYRQLQTYLKDMRHVKEQARTAEGLTAKEKVELERKINKAMKDVSRYGNGLDINDQDNLQQVLSWVEAYREMNKK